MSGQRRRNVVGKDLRAAQGGIRPSQAGQRGKEMNHLLEKFARDWLKEHLAMLPESNHRVFRLMYSHKDLEKPIAAVVDAIPITKLDWAMTQVENSLKKAEAA